MENLGIEKLFGGIYKGKTVLVTGHTGFKGSWLSHWLAKMGAKVVGFALEPNTNPNHFRILNLKIKSEIYNINNIYSIKRIIKHYKPEIIFHLAAQPLVRESYDDPLFTFTTNIIGTANLLEACRNNYFVKAVVAVTSDKCYENNEWLWGYRESDAMGGFDPYSASKGCAELIVSSYRRSFFNLNDYNKTHNTLIATARAGNVIGGGDWSKDRLIPDIVRATEQSDKVMIRNPNSTRPWQHVLDPLSGYLLLGQGLLEGKTDLAEAFNFGPTDEGASTVADIVKLAKKAWDEIDIVVDKSTKHPHEANFLKLDCSKAHNKLNWKNTWELNDTINKTISWYKSYYMGNTIKTDDDITDFIKDAKTKKAIWTK